MKKTIIFIFAILGILNLSAQTQIAILNHNSESSIFYGADALNNAYNNAVDGDVITLSSGTFNSVNFSKLITVRGAGMGVKVKDSDVFLEPTILKGNFNVTADGNTNNQFTLEGISTTDELTLRGTNYTRFVKCHFGKVGFQANYGSLKNCSFIHVYVSEDFSSMYNVTFSAVNCVFKSACFNGNTSLFTLTNCIIDLGETYSGALNSASIKNSVIIYSGDSEYASIDNTSIYNSIWIGKGKEDPFNEKGVKRYNSVFPINSKAFLDNTFYQLTEEAKLYKGSDQTEVGIYGGDLPFTPVSSNLQITKFQVAPKTTSEGKLHINIEVE